MSNQVNDENVGLLKQLVTTVQKKNDKEKVDNSIKMKPAKVIGVDEDTYKVFAYFIDDIEQNAYTFYNKSGEVLSEGDNVRVYYTTNPAKGWIGARCGETNIKEIVVYGGEGVGRASDFDVTSEYFNSYDGSSKNVSGTKGKKSYASARGFNTSATGFYSAAEGCNTEASGESSHAEGFGTKAIGAKSHAEGCYTNASGDFSHAEGHSTVSSGKWSHAEGNSTTSSGQYSHAEGIQTTSSKTASHAEGFLSTASGDDSHAEGQRTTAFGSHSHAEGYNTSATEYGCHAEGDSTLASGSLSHAEGYGTKATGYCSHAEGNTTEATGSQAHSGGYDTKSYGYCSFAHGYGIVAHNGNCSTTAFGQYNDYSNKKFIFMVGNGSDGSNRSNAFAVDQDGNIYCNSIYNINDSNSVFKPYTVNEAISSAITVFNNIMG